jgi:hypothetical protein
MSSEVFMGEHPVPSTWYLANHRSFARYSVLGTRYFVFRWQRQPEDRNHSLSRDIHFRFHGIRQIKRLAVFTTVDFGVWSPGFFGVPAGLLDYVFGIEPAFQMAAAELALLIFLVTGTLSRLLDFDLVMRKLGRCLRVRSHDFASRQRSYPRLRGALAAGVDVTRVIVLER